MSHTRSIQLVLGTPYDCRIGTLRVHLGSLFAVGEKNPRWAAAVKSSFAIVGPLDDILQEVAAKYRTSFQVDYQVDDQNEKKHDGFCILFGLAFEDAGSNARQVHGFLQELATRISERYAHTEQPKPNRLSSTVGKPANNPYSTSSSRLMDQRLQERDEAERRKSVLASK